MARISNIDAPSQKNKAVQDALVEELDLDTQLVLYESLRKGAEHKEEKRQASKAVVLQLPEKTNHESKELSTQAMDTSKEIVWKKALEGLDQQLALYGRLGQGPEQASDKEQAARVVDAMHKVADAHTDPKVKEEYLKKAEKFEKASPKERRKELKALLKGLAILLAAPFLLAGAAIFAAGSVLYGVGSIVKGLGDLVTGGLWNYSSDEASQKQSEASDPSQDSEEQK